MGFDNDCILNIQSLAGEYFCPVCRLLVYPNEALQTQCTHLYCKPCLTYVVSTTHACPYDGYMVTEAECKPLLESNKALAGTIGKIQVRCLYYSNGCTWQGTLSDCSSHCSTCSFGEYPVVCIGCSVQIVHRQVHDHAQNCQGVQPPAQQTVIVQNTASLGARTAAEQRQTVSQTAISTSQVHNIQTSAPLAYDQGVNQAANSDVQPQAVMPTPEQWQQYQHYYQQYYQQYPGYNPFQQNYQYYYQYQQVAQQYPQQPMRGYPQPYGQAQPQVYAQPQLQQQPQIPSHTARSQPAASAPPQGQAQHQLQSQSQGQAQMQSQGPAPSQALPSNQSQPYVQPQPINQQTQVPPYHQTPQVQYYYTQPYPQTQTTQVYPYTHPQSQLQSPPYSQPTFQAPAYPPSQQNQPINPGAQLQTQNVFSGYQSYPQPQPHPHGQGGAARSMHVPGAQPQHLYPPQMQGIYPQSYSNAQNQQLPAVSSAQGQPPSGPSAQQPPVIPHPQQSGYPFQHHPGVIAAQQTVPLQQHGQQQPVAMHGLYMQPQPHMAAHSHVQGPPQMMQRSQQNYEPWHGAQHNRTQSYAARPVALGAGSQPYASAVAHAGHLPQTSRIFGGEKSMHDVNNPNKGSKNLVGGSSAGFLRNEVKVKAETSCGFDGNDSKTPVMGSRLLESDAPAGVLEPSNGKKSAKDVQKKAEAEEFKQTTKNGAPNMPQLNLITQVHVTKGSLGATVKMLLCDREVTGSSPGSSLLQKCKVRSAYITPLWWDPSPDPRLRGCIVHRAALTQVHVTNAYRSVDLGRNQLQPLQYGPSAQLRPGAASMSQSTPHPFNSQKSVIGSPPVQFRQTKPSQAPPRPPFDKGENSQPSSPKYPPGFVPHENTYGEVLTSGSSGPFSRPGNNYYQGSMPPYQADQPKSPRESFGGSSFAAQRPGGFDSHVGLREREPNFEERHPYPMENEKFPVQRPGYFDGRKPEASSYGSVDRAAYGHIQSSAHDSMYAAGMRVERGAFPEERIEHFPLKVEDELKKFPGPSHFEVGHLSKFRAQFASSGALDHGPQVYAGDGPSRPFDKAQQEFDCVSGLKMDCAVGSAPRFLPQFHPNDVGERGQPSDFPNDGMGRGDIGPHADLSGPGAAAGRSCRDGLPPRSPGWDFSGRPSPTFGVFGDGGDVFSAESFGKSIHGSRFPFHPNHLQREEIDVPGNLRVGGPRNQDMHPNHMRMGEPPLTGNFLQHLPFGGEKLGHPLVGEPGFKGSSDFQHFGREGGFYPEEMEPVDDPTKLKPVGLMCRICKVECGTVEGLDYHSQSREHQRNARDMALSIKQQNKRQKISKDQASFEGRDGGRFKKSSFQGRQTKR